MANNEIECSPGEVCLSDSDSEFLIPTPWSDESKNEKRKKDKVIEVMKDKIPSEAVKHGMDDHVLDEIDGAKGQQVPNHVVNKGKMQWNDGTLSRNISSSSNTDGLVAIISKLDNLGRDMKKLKENVHAIQVGCQICEGPHLDKLNEEVKQVEEVKYGEFGHPAPFNGSNGAKFRVGPLGYYTCTDNQTPSREKRPNLVETINKYKEGAAKRQAEQDEWLETFYQTKENS
ncbi:hypothetical protein Tco_0718133 [Tanacetum coccineum]